MSDDTGRVEDGASVDNETSTDSEGVKSPVDTEAWNQAVADFQRHGFEVVEAGNYKKAAEIAKSAKHGDIAKQLKAGREALERLKEREEAEMGELERLQTTSTSLAEQVENLKSELRMSTIQQEVMRLNSSREKPVHPKFIDTREILDFDGESPDALRDFISSKLDEFADEQESVLSQLRPAAVKATPGIGGPGAGGAATPDGRTAGQRTADEQSNRLREILKTDWMSKGVKVVRGKGR